MKQPSILTPAGSAQYPRLNSPDTRFHEDGEYRCNVIVTEKEAKGFEKTLRKLYDQAYKLKCEEEGKKLKKSDHFPVSISDEGEHVIKAKRRGTWTTRDGVKKQNQIAIYDASANPMPNDLIVGAGSKVILSVKPNFWHTGMLGFGCSLTLMGVQVLDLADYTPTTSLGFEAQDGFVHGGETFDEVVKEEDVEEEAEDTLANF